MKRSKGRAAFYTLGCKVSSYETEAVRESFLSSGYTETSFDSVADVYVINTCTVTREADAKSRKYIRRARRKNPDSVVVVMGCYSQRAPKELSLMGDADIIIGNDKKLDAIRLADELLEERARGKKSPPTVTVAPLEGVGFEPMTVSEAPRTRAYVKIEDGCECKCSYCAIAPARGPVRSKPMAEVVSEVEALRDRGTREIVLTGIETGSYGKDIGCSLAELLELLNERGSCERIRLGSMAPELLGEEFVRRVAPLSILVAHFHVSMQSGSSKVLALMRRRYTRERALENLKRIKELMPNTLFTADLMVGFPGESEEDFKETLSFVREIGLLDAHVFAYSEREGTDALKLPLKVSEAEKASRSKLLIAEKNLSRDKVLEGVCKSGRVQEVILETKTKDGFVGHTDTYIETSCKATGHVGGDLVYMIPKYHKNGILYGEITENAN